MSWLALDWAETAPVADVYERVILTQMAGRADKDGTGVWMSAATLARRAVCDTQTIDRRLKALRARGVIAYGNQALAAHIPANRRPRVYDLMIPASAYTDRQLAEVNDLRAENGLAPLTPANRPDLTDVTPSRKTRSDLGAPRPAADEQPLTWSDSQGGLVDTPAIDPGVSSRSPQGGLVDTSGGVYETPNTFSSNRSGEPLGGTTDVTPGGATAAAETPPPPSSPTKADWTRPETWHCAEHLAMVAADPGVDIPGCPKCGRVKAWGRAKQAAAATAADQAARECSWHDAAGDVVDPATGLPFQPVVRCDCVTTSPERAAVLSAAARPADPEGPIAAAGRAEYRRRFPKQPDRAPVKRKVGARTRPPVEPDKSGLGAGRTPVDDHRVAV